MFFWIIAWKLLRIVLIDVNYVNMKRYEIIETCNYQKIKSYYKWLKVPTRGDSSDFLGSVYRYANVLILVCVSVSTNIFIDLIFPTEKNDGLRRCWRYMFFFMNVSVIFWFSFLGCQCYYFYDWSDILLHSKLLYSYSSYFVGRTVGRIVVC